MKKILFGLGVLAVLSFPVVGQAYGEGEHNYPDFKYTYLNQDTDFLRHLFSDTLKIDDDISSSTLIGKKTSNLVDIGEPQSPDFNWWIGLHDEKGSEKNFFYPLSVEQLNKKEGWLGWLTWPENIDFMKHFHNLESLDAVSNSTDFRPIENSKELKKLAIYGPINSFEFIKKLEKLESLNVTAHAVTDRNNYDDKKGYPDDPTVKALTDISFIDSLNNLQDVSIKSDDRQFPTVSLKKSMNKYVLVNPFILSKHFKNPETKITSKTPGFTFEDDILTWDGISPDTKELQISWEFTSNENGDFKFSGVSVIPINWID